jgi:MATE family multidrug resistance protein
MQLSIHRQMWRLAAPIILANIAIPLVGLVDTAIMGHMPDSKYLAAIAVGSLMFSVLYWAMGFLRMSTTGLTAQMLGGVVIGLGLIALQAPFAAIAFPLVGTETHVAEAARRYFDIRIWSAPATLLQFAALGWFIGSRHVKAALAVQIFLNVLNAILDALFVLALDMDIAGVALGTLIAEYAAAVLSIILATRILRRQYGLAITALFRHAALLHGAAWQRLLRMNSDIFLRTLLVIAGYFLFTAVGGRLGTDYLAANTVLMNFFMFATFGLDGIAYATEAMVGADKGAKNPDRLRQSLRVTTIWSAAAAAMFAVFYAIFGSAIVHMLTDLDGVRAMAAIYLIWVVIIPLVAAGSFQLDGIFIGLTLTRAMLYTMAVSFAAYVLALLLLVPAFGNHGLWASFCIFMATRTLVMSLWLRRRTDVFADS